MRSCSPIYACTLLAAAALALAGCGDNSGQATSDASVIRPVKTTSVEATMFGLRRSYPAVIQAAQEVTLSFEVSGRIVELPIRAAMQVAEGDVIARLDTADFEAAVSALEGQRAQAVAQLRGMTAGARSEDIAALQAAVDAAQAQVDQARGQYERTTELLNRGVTTRARAEQDQAALTVAEANLRTAKEELAKGEAGARSEDVEAQEAVIQGLDAQLENARKNLSDATLRAPFGGIIARRDVENFTSVQAKAPIALLQQIDTVELVFDVPGPDVSKFADAEDLAIFVEIDSRPGERFDAELIEFSTQADQSTQTFRGRAAIERPEGRGVLPGMVGTVISTGQHSDEPVVTVPISAIASEADGSSYVWVVADGTEKVAKAPVKLGEATGSQVVVTSGLSAGDVVVTAGLSKLQPDMKVRPITEIGS